MFSKRTYYLIKLQYLGFRYHGWQKQPDVLTVERMMGRTLAYVLGHKKFKLLASGRTDAKVSAHCIYVELFLDEERLDLTTFLPLFNTNLPQDIKALEISEVDKTFNIIEAPELKEYHYFFSFGSKNHPFAAPFMTSTTKILDLDSMIAAAKIFEGTHDFWSYTYKPNPETTTEVTIQTSEIIENTVLTASFFPKKSYLFRVVGKGFKRHQIRLMMGTLFDVGEGNIDLEFIQQTLNPASKIKLERIAPASGLILQNVSLSS